MSADKRSVHTDALETLGTIIDDTQARDAIHLAVEPVVAGERLRPGEPVLLADGKAWFARTDKGLGIVDPFLEGMVSEGQRFWLVVYPRKITSLRHVWSHPDFDDLENDLPTGVDPDRLAAFIAKEQNNANRNSESWIWLRNFADSVSVDVDELIEHATDYQVRGNYWSEGGRFEGEHIPDVFWDHYEAVTGGNVEDRYSFFSCSC